MQKIIVIVGATGSKKTQLALKLAQQFDGEIINADSFQVYKELNAGINKPTAEELSTVKHHLINTHSIYETFDIKVFQDLCVPLINEIIARHKCVILCGGSNLYIDAVIKGYNLDKTDGRHEITHFDQWTYDDIYQYVLDKDPTEALKINYNNHHRIIRAAQIIHANQKPKSQLDQQQFQFIYDCFIIEAWIDREVLYTNLNTRVEQMLTKNWTAEVAALYEKDPQVAKLQAFKAIGYCLVLEAWLSNQPVNLNLIQQQTRQFAKRQLTWNRNKYPKIKRFNVLTDNFDELTEAIKDFLQKT